MLGDESLYSADTFALKPGEWVSEVNGKPLAPAKEGEPAYRNYAMFHECCNSRLASP